MIVHQPVHGPAANPGLMRELNERSVECPYCGERIDVLIDPADLQQTYIEDCQVCCRPIEFEIAMDPDGDLQVRVSSDSE